MGLNSVSKPITINSVTIPNRIIFPAFQTNFAASEDYATERLIRAIAMGGSGLIIAGGIVVSEDGAPNTDTLKATLDKHISGSRELFSFIKENGARLMHARRQTDCHNCLFSLNGQKSVSCPQNPGL